VNPHHENSITGRLQSKSEAPRGNKILSKRGIINMFIDAVIKSRSKDGAGDFFKKHTTH
jgi:hypothetical protein